MIDALVKVVEKLTELARYREQRRDKQFRETVTALYTDMRSVHSDYLRMFEDCHMQLTNRKPISTIAEKLRTDRLENEALRQQILAVSSALMNEEKVGAFKSFFASVNDYFWKFDLRISSGTISGAVLERLQAAATEGEIRETVRSLHEDFGAKMIRESLLMLFVEVLQRIRNAWKDIAEGYARAMAQSL